MSEIKKIALVTGASRGIGRSIATTLAKNGITVIGTATSDSGAEAITEYLKEFGGRGVALNVNDKANIDAVVKDIALKDGDITILVNNAGITKDGLLMRMKEEDWDEVLDTNLKSVFLLVKAAIRGMTKAKFGRIINVASVVGFMGNAGQVNYSAAKGGMIAMTKSLAKEFGSRNVTANCVAPGFIQTDMTDKLPEDVRDAYIKNIPLGRFGQVEDIANAVKYLASDEAGYVTGSTIHVNGGMYV
ncbi:MAG: 3-oxoacyl-[acyl-carrier protein] reductase [Pseudomonadota bacterium]|jgi:3-oxoacyl-[acyl-carrier protein] reductase|nr:3-oxoacyl-ACP reductase FabG [Burkholderiales bacterium]MBP9769824.1 3-oxoacyl-ACP reductase FabG [Burkholderiales bacterium]MDQ5948481.1 3-oxoacyl-[acyl-carrier protein] reductase [Pseudomonadota bacterium]HCY39336.1 3-oxoacyl-ACP reductase [Neisseriales bacterium]